MVPGEGVEPSLPRGNRILNPARLPIPPSGQHILFDKVSLFLQSLELLATRSEPQSLNHRYKKKLKKVVINLIFSLIFSGQFFFLINLK